MGSGGLVKKHECGMCFARLPIFDDLNCSCTKKHKNTEIRFLLGGARFPSGGGTRERISTTL